MPSSQQAATRSKPPVARLASAISLQPSADDPQPYTLCLVSSWGKYDPTVNASIREIPLQLDSAIRQVSCGSGWLCILTENGVVDSMGDNTHGQLAQGHFQPLMRPQPIAFPSSRRITRLSCGTSHGGFILNTGELFMFGCATYGRLGTGRHAESEPRPVHIAMQWSVLHARATSIVSDRCSTLPGAQPIKPVAAAPSQTTPEDADDSVFFTDVSCGDRHTLTLGTRPSSSTSSNSSSGQSRTGSISTNKTHIIAFGDGMNGRLGLGSENDQPTGVVLTQFQSLPAGTSTVPSFASISAGDCHSAAVATTGELFTWGSGSDGQLGHGGTASEWTPRRVQQLQGTSIGSVACGARHTVAVTRSGVVYTWGRGVEGQLGLGSGHSHPLPQRITVTVDPVAAQQAQIDAQIAAGASSANLPTLAPDTKVLVRRVVACQHSTLAVDEQSRLFVWGETAVCREPRQVRWMDLRGEGGTNRKPTSEDRLRLLPRTALVHVDACDAYAVLVFKTKLPVGLSASLATSSSDSREDEAVASTPAETENVMRKGTWQLSAVAPLPPHAIPSREDAYRDYMAGYKVFIRRRNQHDDDEKDEDANSPARTTGRRVSSAPRRPRRGSMAMEIPVRREKQPTTAAESVRGFAAWLARRNASTSSTTQPTPYQRPQSAQPSTSTTTAATPVRPPPRPPVRRPSTAAPSTRPHRPPPP